MNFNFERESTTYKFTQGLKKRIPHIYNWGIKFNQNVLTICVNIDRILSKLSVEEREKFLENNKSFFENFTWIYYKSWRMSRAKSCAHLLDIYNLLNVGFTTHEFVGETFYADIPKVTIKEINEAINK
jgi:hypothetical protein